MARQIAGGRMVKQWVGCGLLAGLLTGLPALAWAQSTAATAAATVNSAAVNLTLPVVLAALVGGLFVLAFFRRFGRDPVTLVPDVPMPAGYVAPYSLSRFQLLWWSGVVAASYTWLLPITGSMDTISTGAMALMGIVGGTSVLAATQDNRPSTKPDDDGAERAKHCANYRTAAAASPPDTAMMASCVAEIYPPSQGVLTDLLTDLHGYNIARLQLLIWTIVLGLSFLFEVAHNRAMPELSANLLALTGISNGTYFGFKMQEKQVAPAAPPTA
ncbi:hypothetical protein [Azospirillum griseum]|uniref:hypothetical protein n=1 Tax=Azospirillum griseum TaxID=2496639 RepID=UPI001AECA825|nr:hypothetical protein [Azospirillum griseum]